MCTTLSIYKQPINKISTAFCSYCIVDVHLYKIFRIDFCARTPPYEICACSAKNGLKLVSLRASMQSIAYNFSQTLYVFWIGQGM